MPSGRRRARGTDWSLDTASFERLLDALSADRAEAAAAYEALHRRVCGLLRWWGARDAEDLADQAIDRVARQLNDGLVITSGSVGTYMRGVARMIFYESARRAGAFDSRAPLEQAEPPAADVEDRRFACLEKCLSVLDSKERSLVMRYYDDGDRAEVRRMLAADMDLTRTALRIRAHRIREKLEACVRACVGKGGGES
jgi:DNA-directed RNA polymerase specialized sigma24 family protein